MTSRSTLNRFADKIALTGTGCIEWLGAVTKSGYGHLWAEVGPCRMGWAYAHRWSYEYHVAPIAAGLQIDHLCRNKICVNPDHLEPVTAQENLLRSTGAAAVNAIKTHCPARHEYDAANTYITARGERQCRACNREREAKRRRRLTSAQGA